MSMPKIVGSNISRKQSVTDVIASVSLEQTALSHVLNAEGEKIQKMLAIDGITRSELLRVNDSVTDTVDVISHLESMLMSKLRLFGDALMPPMPIKFTFYKRDITTSAGLSGAVFEITNSSGRVLETSTSLRGHVTFKKLYAGTYTLTETIAPLGYRMNTVTSFGVTISEDGQVTINGVSAESFVVFNIPYPNLTVMKVSDLDNPLAGGVFQLVGVDRSYKATSDDNGNAIFERIMPGDYVLSETKAPDGYEKSPETYNVNVTDDGILRVDNVQMSSVTMKNKEFIDITVNIMFNDLKNKYHYRPSIVQVDLYQNGVLWYQENVAALDKNSLTIKQLKKYDDNGNLNEYTVNQAPITNYITDIDGFNITNNLETISVSGTVIWDDENDLRKQRPSSVTLRLFEGASQVQMKTITEDDNWQYTFDGLLVGVTYSVSEDSVPFYDTFYNQWDITNKVIRAV